MKIKLDNEGAVEVSSLSFDQLRKLMGEILSSNPNAGKFWDVITCQRGPDSPSERPNMTSKESSAAYAGRRERKHRTVEVIREVSFFGAVGGAARHHKAEAVQLPPSSEWDHFDKHVARAAKALGIKVETLK